MNIHAQALRVGAYIHQLIVSDDRDIAIQGSNLESVLFSSSPPSTHTSLRRPCDYFNPPPLHLTLTSRFSDDLTSLHIQMRACLLDI